MFRKLIKSKALRKRTSWLLALILIPPFIFFFHLFGSSPQQAGPQGAAGILFGEPVPWERYWQQHAWVRRQWENQLAGPDGEPVELPEGLSPWIARDTWDQLMMLSEAERRGLGASDEQVAEVIRRDPLFQVEGRFLPERYRQVVAALGLSPRAFETLMRNQLLIQRVAREILQDVSVSDEEVREAFQQATERIQAALLIVDPATFQDEAQRALTEPELRAAYEAHPEWVQRPAQVTFEYAGITREDLTDTLTIREEDLVNFYDTYAAEWTAQDGTRRPFEEVREEIRAALLPRRISRRLNDVALDLEEALEAEPSFEEVARRFELPRRTVGPLAVGDIAVEAVPEPRLLETAFALEEGMMSDVVETEHGVYVLRVIRREPPHMPPFEAVGDAVRGRLARDRAREAAKAAAEALRTQLAERLAQGDTAHAAAQALGVSLVEPEPFTRTEAIPPIGEPEQFNQVVFDTPIGGVTEALETPVGFALFIPKERIPPDESGFPTQEDSLREQLLLQKRRARLAGWLAELREEAHLQSFVEDGRESAAEPEG